MHSTGRLLRIALLSAVLAPGLGVAQAPQSAPFADSTIQRHFGFFFRPELGFGYTNSGASSGGVDFTVKGGGASLALALGGAVTENFIIGGQVWDVVASSPTVEVSSGSTSVSGSDADTSAGLVGYGLLLNWYLPSNFYVAITPSFTRLVADNGSSSSTSEWGFGVRGAFGKEWWVSNHWGLGVAGSLAVSGNKDSSASNAPTWTTVAFGIGFSATYN
jgi:hypothetical protein